MKAFFLSLSTFNSLILYILLASLTCFIAATCTLLYLCHSLCFDSAAFSWSHMQGTGFHTNICFLGSYTHRKGTGSLIREIKNHTERKNMISRSYCHSTWRMSECNHWWASPHRQIFSFKIQESYLTETMSRYRARLHGIMNLQCDGSDPVHFIQ